MITSTKPTKKTLSPKDIITFSVGPNGVHVKRIDSKKKRKDDFKSKRKPEINRKLNRKRRSLLSLLSGLNLDEYAAESKYAKESHGFLITLTFDKMCLPEMKVQSKMQRLFIKKMRRAFPYAWSLTIVGTQKDGTPHYHIPVGFYKPVSTEFIREWARQTWHELLDSTAVWTHGTETHPLYRDEAGFSKLVIYLASPKNIWTKDSRKSIIQHGDVPKLIKGDLIMSEEVYVRVTAILSKDSKQADFLKRASRNVHRGQRTLMNGDNFIELAIMEGATFFPTEKDENDMGVYNPEKLDEKTRKTLETYILNIEREEKRSVKSVVRIGKMLPDLQSQLPKGWYQAWLEDNTTISYETARRFCHIAQWCQAEPDIPTLNIGIGALNKLIMKKTPDAARAEALRRARSGEKISQKIAQAIINVEKKKAGCVGTEKEKKQDWLETAVTDGYIGRRVASEIRSALSNIHQDTKLFVQEHIITNISTIDALEQLQQENLDLFNQIRDSSGIPYKGDHIIPWVDVTCRDLEIYLEDRRTEEESINAAKIDLGNNHVIYQIDDPDSLHQFIEKISNKGMQPVALLAALEKKTAGSNGRSQPILLGKAAEIFAPFMNEKPLRQPAQANPIRPSNPLVFPRETENPRATNTDFPRREQNIRTNMTILSQT